MCVGTVATSSSSSSMSLSLSMWYLARLSISIIHRIVTGGDDGDDRPSPASGHCAGGSASRENHRAVLSPSNELELKNKKKKINEIVVSVDIIQSSRRDRVVALACSLR